MSLKQHNEIVQKLIKELDKKDSQIQSLKKELQKASTPVIPKISSIPDKQANKKITQLHKEYKQKIDGLTQQIRSKSNENKDLKLRLNTKKNQEVKEKEQIAEVLKKTANISAYDPKFAAVVSHYETQIERKDKHISSLQRQIKQNYYKLQEKGEMIRNEYNSQNEEENDDIESHMKIPRILNDEHYHTKYQQEINCVKNENAKLQKLFSQKSKQFKDLTSRYSQLTKEYYKIMNEYGGKEPIKTDLDIVADKPKLKVNSNRKAAILDQMLERFDVDENSELSYSFLSNMQTNNNGENARKLSEIQVELEKLENILQNIMEILGIENRVQVVPTLIKMKSKNEEFGLHENISKFMHSMLYRLGMGKVPMSEMIGELQKLESRIEKCQSSNDLLDEICFEVGAKKERVEEKIKDLKATQDQFFSNMKDVNFMKQLPKANKVVEFIEYFELDAEICDLPDQLKKMYEQLKYVDRFMKQSLVILDRQPAGLEKTLEIILRFLQRKTAEESLQVKDKPKKSGKTNNAFQLDV